MSESLASANNLRSRWYVEHRSFLQGTQRFFLTLGVLSFCYFIYRHYSSIFLLSVSDCFLIVVFPLLAFFYYGIEIKSFRRFDLRKVGWLKPLLIGFSWSGAVTYFPYIVDKIETGVIYSTENHLMILFLKNFLFITLLGILFDIKDYAMDYNAQIKTVVIRLGLRRTLFYFIIPLCLLGIAACFAEASLYQFTRVQSALSILPFALIIPITYHVSSRRSIFYYLIIIDGLMMLKALCGMTAGALT